MSMTSHDQNNENMEEYEGEGELREDQCEYQDYAEGSHDEDQDEEDDDDDDEEEDEEEEEEEAHLSEEVVNYLSIRERMKDKHRSIPVQNDALLNHSLKNFGSFFGPSKPVIAQRVIQESKSLLETRHLNPKTSTAQNDVRKFRMSSSSTSKDGQMNKPIGKQVKTKVQIIEDTRDYSFLCSDDADAGNTTRDNGPGESSSSQFDCSPPHLHTKSGNSSSISGVLRPSASKDRKQSSGITQVHATVDMPSRKLATGKKTCLGSSDSGRQLDMRRHLRASRQLGVNDRSEPRSVKALSPNTPLSLNDRRLLAGSKHKMPLVGNKTAAGLRNNMLKKEKSGAAEVQMRKLPKQGAFRGNPGGQLIKKQQHGRRAMVDNAPATPNEDRNFRKRKAPDTSLDDEFDYRSEIRSLFGYRPTRYDDDGDDDDMCMEVGFDTIQTEELRSARIARKEDEIELAKIMEEEKQERMRKKARMRKANQQ